ncbi:MAG: hypothetical protein QM776_02495 [Rhodocyclaceae bacterium]
MDASQTTQSYAFFILQSVTAGGQALNEFLRAHPGLFLPPREIVDQYFVQGREKALLIAADGAILPSWPNDYRRGFTLHDFLMTEATAPARVASLLQPGAQFIQLVRDPLEAVWAQYKRFADYGALRELAFTLGVQSGGYEQELPTLSLAETFDFMAGASGMRLNYYSEAERFLAAHDFVDWQIVDARELLPERVDACMASLASTLNVPVFPTPLYQKNFHGTLQKLLGHPFSRLSLNIFGHELTVVLELSANVPYLAHPMRTELARSRCTTRMACGEPQDIELSLLGSEGNWSALPEKLRRYVLDGAMQEMLDSQILPMWLERAAFVCERSEQALRERDIPPPLQAHMRDRLGKDCERLVHRFPRLETLWKTWFRTA